MGLGLLNQSFSRSSLITLIPNQSLRTTTFCIFRNGIVVCVFFFFLIFSSSRINIFHVLFITFRHSQILLKQIWMSWKSFKLIYKLWIVSNSIMTSKNILYLNFSPLSLQILFVKVSATNWGGKLLKEISYTMVNMKMVCFS